jgi:peptidoglycan/xylan/chitin deacetylase (PgdA/CDA1 family)
MTELEGEHATMGAFLDHTKCPPSYVEQITSSHLLGKEGFFQIDALRLYGRTNGGSTSHDCGLSLINVDSFISHGSRSIALPFNPTEIINNIRLEKYVGAINEGTTSMADYTSTLRRGYYALRPFLPGPIRSFLKRIALRDWAKIPFPAWPVDTTVEDFVSLLWIVVLRASGEKEIPFVWYWPKGFQSCAIMTHDVETAAGQEFCTTILELEREYGIKSSFELVPELRYKISERVLEAIRHAGSEICVHGLNHDGTLFSSEQEFRNRAKVINQYAKSWGAKGFRSPVMYRNLAWYDAFDFSYDMSVPNVAHLDPQRGGCCTVFPFSIGDIVELPLTTVQDYFLYYILCSDPMAMWTKQMETIVARHGLVSFIIHPDYTIERKRRAVYHNLLGLMREYVEKSDMWLALPSEVDAWWRQRNAMTLVREKGRWSVCGRGSGQAVVAFARLEKDKVEFSLSKDGTERVSKQNTGL